jgi:type I restriction enzyme S subunit
VIVPKDWQSRPLEDCARFISGNTPSKDNKAFWNGDFPWVSAKDMKSLFLSDAKLGLTTSGRENAKIAPAGSVLVLTRGMTLLKDFPVCLLSCEMAFNQDIKALIPVAGIQGDFLAYMLVAQKAEILNLVDTAGHGTGRLDTDLLKSYRINVPPLPQQRQITETLHAWDRAIVIAEQLLENSRKQKRALVQQLFPKNKDRQALKAGWTMRTLGEIAQISSGGTPSRSDPLYWDGDIPWVTTGEINGKLINGSSEKISRSGMRNSAAKIFPAGTLLMAMYGQGKTRGKVAKLGIDATTNQACAAILVKECYDVDFVYQTLSSSYESIRNLSNSGAQDNLSGSVIRGVRIPIPDDIREQRRLAETLNTFDQAIEAGERQIRISRKQKQALMQQLLTGKRGIPIEQSTTNTDEE